MGNESFRMSKKFQDTIHEANIAAHRMEAMQYELLHPEVFNREEQERIASLLEKMDLRLKNYPKKALDFGAGTGNITGKLLKLDFTVVAIDLSEEMCVILKRKYKSYIETGKLNVMNLPIEDVTFEKDEFDLITCYSALHHLPDYAKEIQRLSIFLKKGGIMYLDHEASPYYWKGELNNFANSIKHLYLHSNPMFNALFFWLKGIHVPSIDYRISDYWHKKEHHIDHNKIKSIFEKEEFEFYRRTDYYPKETWILNPVFYLYRYFCKPEMSYWLAKK